MKKGKKVLVLLGSPTRKGNSAILAEKIAVGAKAAGAAVETVFLHGLAIAPCKACYACQKPKSKGCSIDDDMQPIYHKMLRGRCLGDRKPRLLVHDVRPVEALDGPLPGVAVPTGRTPLRASESPWP